VCRQTFELLNDFCRAHGFIIRQKYVFGKAVKSCCATRAFSK